MSTTPFELRFKVLEMARDLCIDEFQIQYNTFHELKNKIEELLDEKALTAQKTIVLSDAIDNLIDAKPLMPTPEQISNKAKELYRFVSTQA